MNYGCIVENEATNEVCNPSYLISLNGHSLLFHLKIITTPLSFIQVLHYVEKPSTFVSDIINCGLYLFNPDIFRHIGSVFQKNQQDMLLWVEALPHRDLCVGTHVNTIYSISLVLFICLFSLPLSSLPWFLFPHTHHQISVRWVSWYI